MTLQVLLPDERAIISALLDDARAAGLLCSVHDGEEWPVKLTADFGVVRSHVGATDETTLRFRDPAKLDDSGKPSAVGSVFLIHGNGAHVISDHTDNAATAALVRRASIVAERFGA